MNRDYYVSAQAGRDENDGRRPNRAWKTLDRAGQTPLLSGDRLLLRAGETFAGTLALDERSGGTPARPVVVGTFGGGERATIHAGTGDGVRVTNAGGVEVRDLAVVGDGRGKNMGSGVRFVNTLPGAKRLRHVIIENVDARGFGKEGIFVGGDPPDKSQSGYQDVRIAGCVARANVYYGIYVTGVWDPKAIGYANKNVVIENCRAFDNSGDPDYLENHSGSGILLDDVDGGRIERCVARNNGFLCNATVGGPVGIWAHAANNVVIQSCASVENKTGKGLDGGGFDFDGGVTNSVLQYNYSSANDGPGYLLYVYEGAPHTFSGNVVRYNISENDARKNAYAGIFVRNDGSGVRDLAVYHNTVYVSPSNRGGSPRALLVHKTENVRLSNNLLLAAGGVPLVDVGENQPGLRFDNNAYFTTGGPFVIRHGDKTYATLEAWRGATGQERLPAGRNVGLSGADAGVSQPGYGGPNTDPHKTLRAYKARPGSPLIGAALPEPPFRTGGPASRDFWGAPLPRTGGRTIGAHEAARP